MQGVTIEIGLCFIYALLPYVLTIDCYQCTSLAYSNEDCDDVFKGDITTEHLITRDCYYGYWKAHYCIKLKGIRADGSSILVRQCAVNDWGSHCGAIKFEIGGAADEMIEGCLETCDYDGCNLATTNTCNALVFCSAVILSLVWFLAR